MKGSDLKEIEMKRFLLAVVLAALTAATVLAAPAAPATASNQPVRLTYDKSAVAEGVWQGAVGGDFSGSITTYLTGLRITGTIWHIDFELDIEAGDSSLVTDLSGIVDTKTGSVVMDGTVVDGYLQGARVHDEAQLVDPDTLRFQGTILLMPATAG
jgi:opacity protein-like surface antigen